MFEDKTWLIKLENNGIEAITVCKNGYVFDNKLRKLFILKKLAMEVLTDLINEHEKSAINQNSNSRCCVKCNWSNKFVSNNLEFYTKLIDLIYDSNNIKHPLEPLDEIISEIKQIKATDDFDDIVLEYGIDAVVDGLICMYENKDLQNYRS